MGFIFLGIVVLILVLTGLKVKVCINSGKQNAYGIVSAFGFLHFKFRTFVSDNYVFYQINSGNIKKLTIDIPKKDSNKVFPAFPKIVLSRLAITGTVSDKDDAYACNVSCVALDTAIRTLLTALNGKLIIKDFSLTTYPAYEVDAVKFNVEILLKSALVKIFLYVLHTILLNLKIKLFGVRNGKPN